MDFVDVLPLNVIYLLPDRLSDHSKFFGSFFKKELKTHLFKIAF